MKKNLLLFVFTLIILSSCSDSNRKENPPVEPLKSITPRNKHSLSIDVKSKDFLALKNFEDFIEFKEKNAINLNAMTLIKFDKENSSRAILIPLTDQFESTIKRNLLIAFNNNHTRHRLLIIESEGGFSNGSFSGVNKIKTLEEDILIEEYIKNNRTEKIISNDQKNLRQPSGPISSCSYSEFNYYYNILKNNCERDAACDIACSIAGPICLGGIALESLDMCFAYDYNP